MENDVRTLLGQNLKRLRKRKNLSQLQFADKVDMTFTFISDVENGKKWVSPESLSKFSKVLEIEVYQLFLPENCIANPAQDIENFSNELAEAFNKIKSRFGLNS